MCVALQVAGALTAPLLRTWRSRTWSAEFLTDRAFPKAEVTGMPKGGRGIYPGS